MKTPDPLPALRLQVRALWCAVVAFAGVAAAANVRPLHISNVDNTPDTAVSLSSPRWTGTLDAARLPADPVAGKDTAPASVDADGSVRTGGYFATRSNCFTAGDFGIYLNGIEMAGPDGEVIARTYVSAPTVFTETVNFPDGSQLLTDDNKLVWIDAYGNPHTILLTP